MVHVFHPLIHACIGYCWSAFEYEKSEFAIDIVPPVGVLSVTVPVMVTLDPSAGTFCGAETVVALLIQAVAVYFTIHQVVTYDASVCDNVVLIGSC